MGSKMLAGRVCGSSEKLGWMYSYISIYYQECQLFARDDLLCFYYLFCLVLM